MQPVKINTLIRSLNPVTGCPYDCDYCYARKVNNRYKVIPDFSNPQFFEQRLSKLSTKKHTVFFLTSMSDFSIWKPEWIEKVLKVIEENPQNTFLVLTKHPELINLKTNLANLWIGVTITNKAESSRIAILKQRVKCPHYFVTFEPLFEDVGEIDLNGVDWIVIGTETGNRKGKTPTQKDWIVSICRQAENMDVPVFMKESLTNIVGDNLMLQKLPLSFMH